MKDHSTRAWRLDELTWAIDRQDEVKATATHAVASAGSRGVAVLADLLILAAFLAAGAAAVWLVRPGYFAAAVESLRNWPFPLAAVVAGFLGLHTAYAFGFELTGRGRTPGKRLCRLRVIGGNGVPAAGRQLLIRNLLRPVDWLPGFYLLGGFVTVARQAHQRLGDLAAGTLVIYDPPLRVLLAETGTPPSVYSTSEDGYLLEAALSREAHLSPETAETLTARLAQHLHRNYPPGDPFLRELYSQGQFPAYLRALYRHERSTSEGSEVPSGLPEPLPPVDD